LTEPQSGCAEGCLVDASCRLHAYLSLALKLGILAALLLAVSYVGNWLMDRFDIYLTAEIGYTQQNMIVSAMIVYVLLMMLPFVPGVEIGLGLMVMFGPKVAPLVYAGTVLALVMAFLVGRLVPQLTIIRMLQALRLKRAAGLLARIEPLDSRQRLEFLLQNTAARIVPYLLRHRCLALAVALNIPGNAVIGGGGGICLVAGFSRLFSVRQHILTVALAVLPVPLMVFVFGI
jgi:hypothetical protein